MDEVEIQEAIALLESMSTEERVAWAREHGDELTTEQRTSLMYMALDGGAPDPAFNAELERHTNLDPAPSKVDRAQGRFIADNPQVDADQDGQIDDPALAEQSEGDPDFAAKYEFSITWGRPFDESDLDRVFQETGVRYDSASDLVESGYYQELLTDNDRFNSSILADAPPATAYRFVYQGQQVEIPLSAVDNAQTAFGLDTPAGVEAAFRQAASYGITTAAGQVAWQPIAALWKMFGADDSSLAPYREKSGRLLREQADLKAQLRRMGSSRIGAVDVSEGIRQRLAEIDSELRTLRQENGTAVADRPRLTQQFQAGFKQYGNETLAMFHAVDPSLAARLAASPDEISEADFVMIGSVLAKGGLVGESFESLPEAMLALGWADPFARQLYQRQQAALAAAGGGGATRVLPDMEAVRQNSKDLYRQMFLEEPTEDDINRISTAVLGAISGAPDDQNVDINARIRQQLEGSDTYEKYYGRKPSGMTEEEYQGMHRAAQGSMLGDELADNQAVRVGMRQGDYQTTVGAAMGTEEAWDNSTFLGRLARAAQTVGRNT